MFLYSVFLRSNRAPFLRHDLLFRIRFIFHYAKYGQCLRAVTGVRFFSRSHSPFSCARTCNNDYYRAMLLAGYAASANDVEGTFE